MPNPIKGEVLIEISGEQFPLIFSFDAIAVIETEFDKSILKIQEDLSRIDTVYSLLSACLPAKFTKQQLAKEKLPPVLVLQGLIQKALYLAYFGDTEPPEDKEAKKKPTKKK